MSFRNVGNLILLVIAVTVFLFGMDVIQVNAQASNSEDDSEEVFVKEIVFIRPFKDTREVDALKTRRQQIVEMIAVEKNNLPNAPKWTQKNVQAHIKWLEKLLEQVDDDLNKAIKAGTLIDNETLQKLTDEFKNRDLTLEDMNSVADLITMVYQERGYILAKAYVPEQEIKDGVLKIAISEGRTGKIEVSGEKYYKGEVLKRYFQPQLKHGVIREELLERGLLLTDELPSAKTRVVLKKGEKPGTADVVLHTEDKFAVKWSIDYNNFGSELVSEDRYGTHFEITDPWRGWKLALRGVTGNDPEESAMGSANLTIPVNIYGTKLSFSYLDATYAVGQELADLGLEGNTMIYGTKISHPFLKERNKNLSLTLAYDHKYSENYIMNDLQSVDKLNNFYATLDFDSLDRFLGKNIASLSWYRGTVKPDKKAPPSRENFRKRFQRYSIDLARIQQIYGYTNFMIRGSGQITGDRLLPMEQTIIGGYGTVRGHEPSLFLGDSGYVVSGELMLAPPFLGDKTIKGQKIGQMVQLALFFDHGAVYNTDPEPGESRSEFLSGYGGGIRFFYKDIFSFKLDVGFPTTKKTAKEEKEKAFFYIMTSLNFF